MSAGMAPLTQRDCQRVIDELERARQRIRELGPVAPPRPTVVGVDHGRSRGPISEMRTQQRRQCANDPGRPQGNDVVASA